MRLLIFLLGIIGYITSEAHSNPEYLPKWKVDILGGQSNYFDGTLQNPYPINFPRYFNENAMNTIEYHIGFRISKSISRSFGLIVNTQFEKKEVSGRNTKEYKTRERAYNLVDLGVEYLIPILNPKFHLSLQGGLNYRSGYVDAYNNYELEELWLGDIHEAGFNSGINLNYFLSEGVHFTGAFTYYNFLWRTPSQFYAQSPYKPDQHSLMVKLGVGWSL